MNSINVICWINLTKVTRVNIRCLCRQYLLFDLWLKSLLPPRTLFECTVHLVQIANRFFIKFISTKGNHFILTKTLTTFLLLLFVSLHSEYIFHTFQLSGTLVKWSSIACTFSFPRRASFSHQLQVLKVWWCLLRDVSSFLNRTNKSNVQPFWESK